MFYQLRPQQHVWITNKTINWSGFGENTTFQDQILGFGKYWFTEYFILHERKHSNMSE